MSQDLNNALNNLTDELQRHRKTYDNATSYADAGSETNDVSDVSAASDNNMQTYAGTYCEIPDHHDDMPDSSLLNDESYARDAEYGAAHDLDCHDDHCMDDHDIDDHD